MPQNLGLEENLKNYVFIDEHQRHKRMKRKRTKSYDLAKLISVVLRACERCRRRKIKCDAASTNTWPCSACKRLNILCISPILNSIQEPVAKIGSQKLDADLTIREEGGNDKPERQLLYMQKFRKGEQINNHCEYDESQYKTSQGFVVEPFFDYTQPINTNQKLPNFSQQLLSAAPSATSHSSSPILPHTAKEKSRSKKDLADLLGELMIGENGTAPYLSKNVQSKAPLEEPAFGDIEEYSDLLVPSLYGPDLKVRIPPELMPEEDICLQYFCIYFENIHPYVPVLNKYLFYQQWYTNRDSISPLILEAIFALACQLTGRPSESNQWLMLSSKHASSFLDRPRLSTLQATLILLKGREAFPRRGYYYRSWMTVVQCIEMARDLGLDNHFINHKAGKSCGSDIRNCNLKNCIWHTIFVCEMMIGTPQGRTTLSVEMESLDLCTSQVSLENLHEEFSTTRNFILLAIICRNIRLLNEVQAKIYQKTKKEKLMLESDFALLQQLFESWMKGLPSELQLTYPTDETPPWLSSHFIGNLHSYYHLSIIMLHRSQLKFLKPNGKDGRWKYHMNACFTSAKYLCMLQEAILQLFGATGFLHMQRGTNFTIYCILTSSASLLLLLISSDPDLNLSAREYFTRYMRILEKCSGFWPMSDIEQQISALREASSADINKPFVLKPSFPYDSSYTLENSSYPHYPLDLFRDK